MKSVFSKIGKRTRILIVVGIAIITVIAFVMIRRNATTSTSYQTSPLTRGDLTAIVGATGSVHAAQSAALVWQTSGTVDVVAVKAGQKVAKDALLASLLMDSVPQNVIQAQASLVTAEKALEDAKSGTGSAQAAITLQAAKDAYKKAYDYRVSLNGKQWIKEVRIRYSGGMAIPEVTWHRGYVDAETIAKADNTLALRTAQLEDAQRNYDRLKDGPNSQDIAAAQANVDAIKATLGLADITAPFAGTVTQANPLPGDQAALGAPAFRVDDLSSLLVDVQVSEVDINRVKLGQPVQLTLDAVPDKTYNGTVDEVAQSGTTVAGAVNFTVTVRLTDADALVKPGMTAAVNIVVRQIADQLLVPNRAVRIINGQQNVYVLRNTQPVAVPIVLGDTSDTMSVLASGDITEGELIVLNPPSTGFGQMRPPFAGGGQ